MSSHVVQQAGRNTSKLVALQLANYVWHQHDSIAEDQLRITDPLMNMVLSYRNLTLVPVFLASAPFRLVSCSSFVAAPRWKLCLYCFLLRLQGNGQKDCILQVCSGNWQEHRLFGWSVQGQVFSSVIMVHTMGNACIQHDICIARHQCCIIATRNAMLCMHACCSMSVSAATLGSQIMVCHSWTEHAALLSRRCL